MTLACGGVGERAIGWLVAFISEPRTQRAFERSSGHAAIDRVAAVFGISATCQAPDRLLRSKTRCVRGSD